MNLFERMQQLAGLNEDWTDYRKDLRAMGMTGAEYRQQQEDDFNRSWVKEFFAEVERELLDLLRKFGGSSNKVEGHPNNDKTRYTFATKERNGDEVSLTVEWNQYNANVVDLRIERGGHKVKQWKQPLKREHHATSDVGRAKIKSQVSFLIRKRFADELRTLKIEW